MHACTIRKAVLLTLCAVPVAAIAAVPSARSMAECRLTANEAWAESQKLKALTADQEEDQDGIHEFQTIDPAGIAPFGFAAQSLTIYAYTGYGVSTTYTSKLAAPFEATRAAALKARARAECLSGDDKICLVDQVKVSATNPRALDIFVKRIPEGGTELICEYR